MFIKVTNLVYWPCYSLSCILLITAESPPEDIPLEDLPENLELNIDEANSDSKYGKNMSCKSALHNKFI